jgi:aspartyl aminopeptidase
MKVLATATPEAATRFVQYVNASPTPFHAVHNAALRLESAGFKRV